MQHKITITIDQDTDSENPMSWNSAWRLVRFCDRYNRHSYRESEGITNEHYEDYQNLSTLNMLRAGTAFTVHFHDERGEFNHVIRDKYIGSDHPCYADIAEASGILICDNKTNLSSHKTDYATRLKDAEGTLETLSAYYAGEVVYYTLDFECGECTMNAYADSCGGLYVNDTESVNYLRSVIQDGIDNYICQLPADLDHDFKVVLDGDCSSIFSTSDFNALTKPIRS